MLHSLLLFGDCFTCGFALRVENEDREPDPTLLNALESFAPGAVGSNWGAALDVELIANLGRYRRYDYTCLRDLLRVVRNKRNHFREMPESLQQLMGPLPTGYYRCAPSSMQFHCTGGLLAFCASLGGPHMVFLGCKLAHGCFIDGLLVPLCDLCLVKHGPPSYTQPWAASHAAPKHPAATSSSTASSCGIMRGTVLASVLRSCCSLWLHGLSALCCSAGTSAAASPCCCWQCSSLPSRTCQTTPTSPSTSQQAGWMQAVNQAAYLRPSIGPGTAWQPRQLGQANWLYQQELQQQTLAWQLQQQQRVLLQARATAGGTAAQASLGRARVSLQRQHSRCRPLLGLQ